MDAARRGAVKRQHGFDTWPGRESAPIQGAFLPDLERIPGYIHERRSALPGSRNAFSDHFAEAGGNGRISVRVVQFDSAVDAQEELIEVLCYSMAPRLPRCGERDLDLGDPCFCGFGDPVDFVAFARANVFIRIDSIGREPVSVAAVAVELDRQLLEAT